MEYTTPDKQIMRNVAVKNSNILEALNPWKDWVLSNKENIIRNFKCHDTTSDGWRGFEGNGKGMPSDYFFTDDYRNSIVQMGQKHDGYPAGGKFYNLRPEQADPEPDHYFDGAFKNDFIDTYNKFNDKLILDLGIRRNALCTAYPEDGFIGWHNNANASSYNLIFTYSETGNGYWQHIDPHTSEIVTVPDIKGWQCKAFYFGAYDEDPEHLVYHTARSIEGWRLTISYVFDRHNKDWWLDAIEEIEND